MVLRVGVVKVWSMLPPERLGGCSLQQGTSKANATLLLSFSAPFVDLTTKKQLLGIPRFLAGQGDSHPNLDQFHPIARFSISHSRPPLLADRQFAPQNPAKRPNVPSTCSTRLKWRRQNRRPSKRNRGSHHTRPIHPTTLPPSPRNNRADHPHNPPPPGSARQQHELHGQAKIQRPPPGHQQRRHPQSPRLRLCNSSRRPTLDDTKHRPAPPDSQHARPPRSRIPPRPNTLHVLVARIHHQDGHQRPRVPGQEAARRGAAVDTVQIRRRRRLVPVQRPAHDDDDIKRHAAKVDALGEPRAALVERRHVRAQVLPRRPRPAAPAAGDVPGADGLDAQAGARERGGVGQARVDVPGQGARAVRAVRAGAGGGGEPQGGGRQGDFGADCVRGGGGGGE